MSLKTDDVTIAQILKGSEWKRSFDENYGYPVGIFGKWGLGDPGMSGLPNDHGFDEWYGFLNQQHAQDAGNAEGQLERPAARVRLGFDGARGALFLGSPSL